MALCIVYPLNNAHIILIGTVDLIESLNLGRATSNGLVEIFDGFCPNREGMGSGPTSDRAYTIKDRAVGSRPTAQLFSGGFPSGIVFFYISFILQ